MRQPPTKPCPCRINAALRPTGGVKLQGVAARGRQECRSVRREGLPASPGGCLFKAAQVPMNEPKAESPGCGKSGKAAIYLVDDEPMLLELAAVILEPMGYTVETFRSPENGAARLRRRRATAGLDHHRLRDAHDDRLGARAGVPADTAPAEGSPGQRHGGAGDSPPYGGQPGSVPGQAVSGKAAQRRRESAAGRLARFRISQGLERDWRALGVTIS